MEEEGLKSAPFLIVIGGSAGSLDVLMQLLPNWNLPYDAALILVVHRGDDTESALSQLLDARCPWPVKEASDKDLIAIGKAYVAPYDYHLLIERNGTLSLDYSEKINYSRPSIDPTFETASTAYGKRMAAILLSGANTDGTNGLEYVRRNGGKIIIQDPASASMPFMPQHALNTIFPDAVLEPGKMMDYLQSLQW